MSWAILVGAAVILVIPFAVYAFLIEPYRVRLTEIEIPVTNLPEALDGFKICHLSDTHAARYGRLEKETARILSQVDADLCVITGDLLDSEKGIMALRRMLNAFTPRLGAFAVLGNADHRMCLSAAEIADDLADVEIDVLVNDHRTISRNGHELQVIGVDDPFRGRDELGRATAGMPGRGFKLLLAHSPDILSEVNGHHVDLVLAGHTHGGQVRLPFIGPVWLHSSRHIPVCSGYFDSKTLSRLLKRDMSGVRMYVSRGLGASGIAARFACPPEVALITLRAKFEPGRKMV